MLIRSALRSYVVVPSRISIIGIELLSADTHLPVRSVGMYSAGPAVLLASPGLVGLHADMRTMVESDNGFVKRFMLPYRTSGSLDAINFFN